MNSILLIIGLVILMYIVLRIFFMLQNKAPVIEKFLEAPFAKFKKNGDDQDGSILDNGDENNGMFNENDYNLPVNYEIKKILSNYLKSNENCEIGRSDLYYKVFVTALRNFIRYNFIKTLGYVPDNDTLSVTDTREYRRYKKILQNIPDCYDLMKNFLKIDVNELDVQPGGQRVGKNSKTIKKLGMYTGDEHATYGKEDGNLAAEVPPREKTGTKTKDEGGDDAESKQVDTKNDNKGYLSQFGKILNDSPPNKSKSLPELSHPNEKHKKQQATDEESSPPSEKQAHYNSLLQSLGHGFGVSRSN